MAADPGHGPRRSGGAARTRAAVLRLSGSAWPTPRRWWPTACGAGPAQRQLALEAARIAAQRESYPEAARRYHRALAMPGAATAPLEELAQVLVAQHRFAAATAILDRLAAAEPAQPRWREALARAAEEEGDLERALGQWEGVLRLDPRHLRARVAIGRLHEDAARLAQAEMTFRDLAEIRPDAIEPLCQLGRMAMAQSSFAEARTWLDRALALRPDDAGATALMARALAGQGGFRKALSMALALAERLPDHLDAHLLVAWVEERAGRIGRAAAELRRTRSRFPQAFQPPLRLAELLARAGRVREGRAALEAAHVDHPDTLAIRLALVDLRFASPSAQRPDSLIEALYADYPAHREVKKRVARLEAVYGRHGPARRLWAQVARFDRRVSGPPLHLERLDDRPIPPAAGEIRLFTRIRNEATRLPWLFDFYRKQGVDRFFVVDNGSDDGSREYLLGRPDTHLYLTTDSYAVFGGGIRWLNHLLERHGSGAWCLTVDVDEVLAYPHAERLGLKALTAHLDRQGAQGLFAFMLDMYAEHGLQEVAYQAGDNPFAHCRCFDRAGYIRRDDPDFPFRMVAGGLVSRFLYDRKLDGVFLHKVPLVRWQEELRYTCSTHTLYPVPLAQETGVLLHFKFIAGFIDRARIEAERQQYWQGAKRYAEFSRRMDTSQPIDFRCELTERFVSTAQLVELGLMTGSPALDAVAAGLETAPLPAGLARSVVSCAPTSIGVLLPCRNSRHLLWRSLASVAAQTVSPAQILVLDRDSTDGLGDWLRVRWPGVEMRKVAGEADAATIGAAISTAVSSPAVAVLCPGAHWPRNHLELLLTRPVGETPDLLPTATLAAPAGAATLPWPADHEPPPSPLALEAAIASLPASVEVILLDLRAAGAPCGLLALLGLASLLGPTGRSPRALTLADPTLPELDGAPPSAPLMISLSGTLGVARASEQLCIEELLRRAAHRPVRLVLGGICPSSPPLLSRLLDAALAHPDLELWVGDAVSRRLAASLIGYDRVRLVSPPLLALAPILAELNGREPIEPAMLGTPERRCNLTLRVHDHAAWWAGFDPEATRRLGLALARVMGTWRWLRGPVLQQAWFSALVGWAAARSLDGPIRTGDLELAMFAGLCGRSVALAATDAKQRDLVATWREVLGGHGIAIA